MNNDILYIEYQIYHKAVDSHHPNRYLTFSLFYGFAFLHQVTIK